MDNFFIYLLKACLGITIFVVPYFFLLRNDSALHLKRFFLLGGVFASFLFPFLALKRPAVVEVYSPVVSVEPDFVVPQMEAIPVEVATGIDIHWPTVLLAIYLCGALILLFRNVFMLLKWNAVWKKAERKGTGVAYSGNDEIFAMFSRVFLPDRLQNTKEIDSILLHEKAHIRQLHFIDLIIAETTMLLTWFNPFTWLLTAMVKENHEHLADRMVLNEGIDPVEYRTQLLNETMGVQVFSLAHPFNRSSVKNRFDMMKQSRSIRSGLLKVAVFLPLILISLGMAVGKVRQGDTVSGKIVFSDTGEPAHGTSVIAKNTTMGTVADEEGNYQLELKERAEVVFSYVGYKTQSYWFNPGEYRFVVLEREVINLIPPVIMIDGVKSDYSSPDEIDPDIIASIRSFDRFGKEGGTDMYMITTKKSKDSKSDLNALTDNDNPYVKGINPGIGKDSIKYHLAQFRGEHPIFPGQSPSSPFIGSFQKFVYENIEYPELEKKQGVEGIVLASFVVQASGRISDIKIESSPRESFSKAVVKVLESSPPDWTPTTRDGKPIQSTVKLPVEFRLREGKGSNEVKKLSQENSPKFRSEEKEVFFIVEEMPQFNNGDAATEFRKYIVENLQYPQEEAAMGTGGRIIVQFRVSSDGSVKDAIVVRSVSPGLDKEALRVVESSPAWTPGKQRGQAVNVLFTFPVNFIIQEGRSTSPDSISGNMISRKVKPEFSYSQNAVKAINNPRHGFTSASYLKITRIELNKRSTVLYFDVAFRPEWWIRVPEKTYIRPDNASKRLYIKSAEGIPLNEKFYMPESGRISYKLHFPPIDKNASSIDYGEDENLQRGWYINNIALIE